MPGRPSALVRDEFQHGCGDGRRSRGLQRSRSVRGTGEPAAAGRCARRGAGGAAGDRGARRASGRVSRERIPVRPPQSIDREGGRCGGQPRLAAVWWDPPRDRALLLVIFPGRDLCEDEPALWLVW
jgi:hypothetical protein